MIAQFQLLKNIILLLFRDQYMTIF